MADPKPINKYTIAGRVEATEKVAREALNSAKAAHERFDLAPPRGIAGTQGPKGESIVGPAGPAGPPGKDAVGIRGATGLMGATGATGRGERGLPGVSDVAGPVGPRGMQGPSGRDGATGPRGPQGAIGPDTASALAEFERLKAELSAIRTMLDGMLDMNRNAKRYVSWLREQVLTK